MLITKPNTDQSATFTLYANGTPCSEFVLPGRVRDPNAAEVFVAVPPGATLTLSGTVSGSLLRCRIDLLADGSFVNNRVIEAGPGGGRQGLLYGRKVEFKSAYTVPHPTVHERNKRAKVVEGDLVIQPLPAATPHRLLDGRGANLGVGSIALVFSLCQVEGEKYGKDGEASYPDHTLGGWKTGLEDVRGSGRKPDYSLGMDIYKDANPISDKKANVFWRDYTNTRPGNAPWGTIVFYYRSLGAIEKGGCLPMKDGHALAPFAGRFIKAEAPPKMDERIVASARTSGESSGTESLLTIPEPSEEVYSVKGKRRKLDVGQRSSLPQSNAASGIVSLSSPTTVASHAIPDTTLLLAGSLQPGAEQDQLVPTTQLPQATAPNVVSGALFDAFAKLSSTNSPSVPAAAGSHLPSSLGKRPSHTSPSATNLTTAPTALMLPPTELTSTLPAPRALPGISSLLSASTRTSPIPSSPALNPKKSRLAELQDRKAALQVEIAAERERKAAVVAQAEQQRQAREVARAQREAEEREAIQREQAERVLREREETERVKAEERAKLKREEEERLEREREEAELMRQEEEAMERELEDLKKVAEREREARMVAEAEAEVEALEEQVQGFGQQAEIGEVAGQVRGFGQQAADDGELKLTGNEAQELWDELFGTTTGGIGFVMPDVEMTDDAVADNATTGDGVPNNSKSTPAMPETIASVLLAPRLTTPADSETSN
ncbi:hypothetical protein LTR95_017430, partial [Oleoguttula sp. CCFEE 5521]